MSGELETQSLDEIFDGKEVEAEAITTDEVKEPEVKTEQPTGVEEEVKAEAETDTDDSPPESEEKAEPSVEVQLKAQIAKAQDEKQKRQALQQQLEAIQSKQPQEELPDAFAEPDKAIAVAISQVEQKFQNQILNMSEQGAKSRYTDDFDAMKDHFFDVMAVENPALQAQALQQVDPYEYIYRTAKNHKELAQLTEVGGVDAYRENIEKELRAKWDSEQAAKTKDEIEKKINDSIPGSLANQRAAGNNKASQDEWSGDQPLDQIVG